MTTHKPDRFLQGPLAKRIVVPPKPALDVWQGGRSYTTPIGQMARTLFVKRTEQGGSGGKSGMVLRASL